MNNNNNNNNNSSQKLILASFTLIVLNISKEKKMART